MDKTGIVIDDFRLRRADSLNWVLEKKYYPKSGKNKDKLTWKNAGYFRKLDQVATFLFDQQISDENVKSLHDLKRSVSRSRSLIMNAFRKIEKKLEQ